MDSTKSSTSLEVTGKTVQIVSVVVGVVISVLSFNATRNKEAEDQKIRTLDLDITRQKEAEAQKLAAMKPFLELRQKLYLEAVKAAGVLSNPETHSEEEVKAARKRFRALYVAELSMVEDISVEGKMKAMAASVDPDLLSFTKGQSAAYDLSHALRDSFVTAWGISEK